MLFKEIIVVCVESLTESIIQNEKLPSVEAGGTQSYRGAVEG
jgi:hypothetical protein